MAKCATATTSSCQLNWLTVTIPGPNKAEYLSGDRLHGRALEEHVALIPKTVHGTLRAVAQSPSTAMAPTQDIWETVSPHPKTQECTQATSTKRLRTWAV